MGPQGGRRPESTRSGHQALDFLCAEDIGDWSLAPTTEDPCWWEFMPRVLRVDKAGKAPHCHQSIVPLRLRGRGGRPVHRGLRDHMRLATRGSKAGEAPQIELNGFELKASRTPHSQIGINRCHQHVAPYGQGLTTCWNRRKSTLAYP